MRWNSLFYSLSLIVIIAFVGGVKAAEEAASSAVSILTTASFDEFLKANPLSLVKFMAPWCGHCKKLAPEFETAATELKKLGAEIALAEVDATKEEDLAQKYGVQGFPTIFLFRNGKPEPYSGGRTSQTIVDWVKKMTGPAVEYADSRGAAETLIKETKIAFLGALKSKTDEAGKLFESIANDNRSRGKFIGYVDATLPTSTITAIRVDEDHVTQDIGTSKDDLQTFVENESIPLFGLIGGDNYAAYAARSNNWLWVAAGKEDAQKLGTVIRKVSKNYRTEFNFVWLDSEQHKMHAEGALGLKDLPGMVIVYEEAKYHYPDELLKATEKSVSKFIQNVKSGRAKRFLKTEEVPEKNDEAVKVVVGSNFAEMVLQKDKDVMLEIYAPWCGHCKKLTPVYEEVAEKIADNTHVLLTKIDGTANEIPVPDFSYQGFPTLYFIKAGSKTPTPYDGARTVSGIIDFLKENASRPLVVKKDETASGKDEENKDEL